MRKQLLNLHAISLIKVKIFYGKYEIFYIKLETILIKNNSSLVPRYYTVKLVNNVKYEVFNNNIIKSIYQKNQK